MDGRIQSVKAVAVFIDKGASSTDSDGLAEANQCYCMGK